MINTPTTISPVFEQLLVDLNERYPEVCKIAESIVYHMVLDMQRMNVFKQFDLIMIKLFTITVLIEFNINVKGFDGSEKFHELLAMRKEIDSFGLVDAVSSFISDEQLKRLASL